MEYRLKYEDELKTIISDYFSIDISSLNKMDSCEGILFTNNNVVFKCLTLFNEQNDLINYSIKHNNLLSSKIKDLHNSFNHTEQDILHHFFILKALSESKKTKKTKRIIDFDVFYIKKYIILKMPFVVVSNYEGGYEDEMVELMKELKSIGWVCTDITPKNLKILDKSKQILLIDIGFFFSPYYNELFQAMCRRAFISIHFADSPELKILLRNANTDVTFSFLDNKTEYLNEFNNFYNKISSEKVNS